MESHEVLAQHISTLTKVGVIVYLRNKVTILILLIKQSNTHVPQAPTPSSAVETQHLEAQLAKPALSVTFALTLLYHHKFVHLVHTNLQQVRPPASLALQGLTPSSVNWNATSHLLVTNLQVRLVYPVCAMLVHTVIKVQARV